MTETEKIKYAKSFIDKLANGINPLDDSPIPEGEVINQLRISRCLFFVSDVLRKITENEFAANEKKQKKQKKLPFTLSPETISQIEASDKPKWITEIASYISSFADKTLYRSLSHQAISSWLIDIGALRVITGEDGKKKKLPTEQGRELGIFTEEKVGMRGPYTATLYDKNAQQFIIDNLEAILAYKEEKRKN